MGCATADYLRNALDLIASRFPESLPLVSEFYLRQYSLSSLSHPLSEVELGLSLTSVYVESALPSGMC